MGGASPGRGAFDPCPRPARHYPQRGRLAPCRTGKGNGSFGKKGHWPTAICRGCRSLPRCAGGGPPGSDGTEKTKQNKTQTQPMAVHPLVQTNNKQGLPAVLSARRVDESSCNEH